MPVRKIFALKTPPRWALTPRRWKNLILLTTTIFLFYPKIVFARVVINEFSSYGSSDWVEIYRTKTENLSLYYLEDAAGNTKQLSWADCIGDFCTADWSNRLNNSDDVIKLFLAGYPLPEDQVAYGDVENSVVAAPEEGQSAGRRTDGASSWIIFSTPTKGSTNDTATPAPTNTPTPVPTSTPVPTPTSTPPQKPTNTPAPSFTPTPTSSPTKATYKINEVKDSDGNVLTSVKIYIDDTYIHHYAPEELKFCGDCYCDDNKKVKCDFGEHTIKLEKSGYQDWSKTITVSAAYSDEVDPVMNKSSSSSSATSTPTRSPTPTKKPTPAAYYTVAPTARAYLLGGESSLSGQILGEEATLSMAIVSFPESTEGATASPSSKRRKVLKGALFALGGLSIFGAGVLLFKKKGLLKGMIKLP